MVQGGPGLQGLKMLGLGFGVLRFRGPWFRCSDTDRI